MPQRLLTDRFCAGAKPRDGEAQTDYFDTQVSGLALRVSEGRKSWTLHYTLGGKRHRLTFGSYPAIALAGARTRADEACAAVASGHDPKSIASETLQAICELYLAREGGKLRTVKWRKGVLDRHVYPTLGSRPIAEIKRSEIVRLLDKIEGGSGSVMATQTLAIIRKVMNWHATRSDDFLSPIVRGMARTQRSERARERILTDDELRKVWATHSGVFSDYVRFLLLTAARRNEVSEMTRAELDGADWTLPARRNKTGWILSVLSASQPRRSLRACRRLRDLSGQPMVAQRQSVASLSSSNASTLLVVRRDGPFTICAAQPDH
jgi:integrase